MTVETQSEIEDGARGASMVELTIALPVLVLLLAAVVDLGFYFIILGTLNFFVHDALDLASRLDMTVDTSTESCMSVPASCAEYRARKQRVLSRVEQPMSSLFIQPYQTQGTASFERFSNSSDYGAAWSASAYFIRPGESWTRDSNMAIIDHPTRSRTLGGPSGSETWHTIFRDHPLIVGAMVNYRPIFTGFFLGNKTIRAEAIGYHRSKYYGQGAPSDPGASTPVSGSPVPTPTPGNPTPTPVPTAPGTPTPVPPCAWCRPAGNCCVPYVPQCCLGYGG